jgi:hypothetical protein
MNKMRNPVPGVALLSSVQCPICQTLVPLLTDNTINVATIAIFLNGEPTHVLEIAKKLAINRDISKR